MPFNSLAYVLLLSGTWVLCALTARHVRWIPFAALCAASLVFYAVAGAFDFCVFLTVVCLNWLIQLAQFPFRLRIGAAVLVNIGCIAFFKYQGMLFGEAGTQGSYLNLALPLGISFYCFQALAYHIDIAKGEAKPAQSFISFFLFKSFFPQLVAGPIVRVNQFLPQIERLMDGIWRRHRLISFGLGLCLLGLIKKVVFADSLAPHADLIFSGPPLDMAQAWLGALLFTFQIYFDFSGYSDIAIGSAYLLGLRLPFNFATPYISTGPREFWQRWHISLSTWIRDYVYIPLGGSRGTVLQAAIVLIGTMALAGLWHGANYTFIIWGACWGIYIFLGRFLAPFIRLPWPLAWAGHFSIIVMLWVLFRSPDLSYASSYLMTMCGFGDGLAGQSLTHTASVFGTASAFLGIGGLMLLHVLEARVQSRRAVMMLRRYNGPFLWGVMTGVCMLLVLIPSMAANPFIYFRF